MSKLALFLAVIAVGAAMAASIVQAATQEDFDAAYRAAEQAERQAGALHNQWTPTEVALKAAKKAAEAKDYDQAAALARHAETLAKVSIEQAKEQGKVWRDAVVK